MSKQKCFITLLSAALSLSVFSQASHTIIDPEKQYKDVKEMMMKEQYALAYPLVKELKDRLRLELDY